MFEVSCLNRNVSDTAKVDHRINGALFRNKQLLLLFSHISTAAEQSYDTTDFLNPSFLLLAFKFVNCCNCGAVSSWSCVSCSKCLTVTSKLEYELSQSKIEMSEESLE